MFRSLFVAPFVLMLWLTSPAQAQVAKPAGVPTATIPDYNMQVAVFCFQGFLGTGCGVMEFHPQDSLWYGFIDSGPTPQMGGQFDAMVAAAGGFQQWTAAVLVPKVNEVLARRFPPITGPGVPPSGTEAYQLINATLTNYMLRYQNGIEVLGPK